MRQTLTWRAESAPKDLRDALNGCELDLRANLLNDGTGECLVLQAKETGVDETIAVGMMMMAMMETALASSRFAQARFTELSVAQDAKAR